MFRRIFSVNRCHSRCVRSRKHSVHTCFFADCEQSPQVRHVQTDKARRQNWLTAKTDCGSCWSMTTIICKPAFVGRLMYHLHNVSLLSPTCRGCCWWRFLFRDMRVTMFSALGLIRSWPYRYWEYSIAGQYFSFLLPEFDYLSLKEIEPQGIYNEKRQKSKKMPL